MISSFIAVDVRHPPPPRGRGPYHWPLGKRFYFGGERLAAFGHMSGLLARTGSAGPDEVRRPSAPNQGGELWAPDPLRSVRWSSIVSPCRSSRLRRARQTLEPAFSFQVRCPRLKSGLGVDGGAEGPPVVMIAQTIRASLLANATATTLAGLRALSAASQSHNAPLRFGAARKTEMAPNTRSRRIYRLPCLVIDPNFSLPPVEFCLGVAPSQAAKSRPDLKACGSGALARIAEAASAPTPGTLAASRLTDRVDGWRRSRARARRSPRRETAIAQAELPASPGPSPEGPRRRLSRRVPRRG